MRNLVLSRPVECAGEEEPAVALSLLPPIDCEPGRSGKRGYRQFNPRSLD